MPIIVEGNVSKHILSFSHGEFIFTAPVCKSWNANASCRETSSAEALQSLSRVKEMHECGAIDKCGGSLFRAVQVSRNVPVLRYLKSKGVPLTRYWDDLNRYQRIHGDESCLEHVQTLLDNDLGEFSCEEVVSLIQHQQISAAKRLIEEGCPLYDNYVGAALFCLDLDFAKWLSFVGCEPMDQDYSIMFDDMWRDDEAMNFDFIPMLEWLYSTGTRPYGARSVDEFQQGNRNLQDMFDSRPDVKEWFERMFSRFGWQQVG